jgi:hypothetical protein
VLELEQFNEFNSSFLPLLSEVRIKSLPYYSDLLNVACEVNMIINYIKYKKEVDEYFSLCRCLYFTIKQSMTFSEDYKEDVDTPLAEKIYENNMFKEAINNHK